jgi:peptidoglycan/xylan/chitin deacetylase (PgdA/CDA1 family)
MLRVDNVLRPGTYNGFAKIMEVVNNNNIICVIDVTPKWHGESNHDPEYINFIKEQLDRGHILALHGVEHRCRILPEAEHKLSWLPSEDEFDCKDYHAIHGEDIPVETQKEWLREGNELLRKLFGQTTNLLMPPAHAFNQNTLQAMREEGFHGISDYGRWDAGPYIKDGITVFPFDFEDYMKNTREDGKNMDAMLEMFKKYFNAATKQKGYYATFVHCDFSGDGEASQSRLDMLDNMIKYSKSKGFSFVSPNSLLLNMEDKNESRNIFKR